MMYDYESDLIEFWGKVIFFGAFILIWALVFYFVMYSFPFLFIPPPFHSPFDIFYHTFFLVRLCFLYSFFFTHGQTTTPTSTRILSGRKYQSRIRILAEPGGLAWLVSVSLTYFPACLSLSFLLPCDAVFAFALGGGQTDKQTGGVTHCTRCTARSLALPPALLIIF